MSNGILVFVEHRAGVLNKTSLEAIAAGQSFGSQLQQPVSAVVLGSNVNNIAQEIAAYDIQKVLYAENEKLASYTPDAYTDAMAGVVRQVDPNLVVMPHTYLVRDYAPKLAARFQKSLISDCVRAQVTNGAITFTRRIFLGKSTQTLFPMVMRRCLRHFNRVPIALTRQ